MALFLVRHDQTDLTGVCYGQTDIDACVPYLETAQRLRPQLPSQPTCIATSPLRRCAQLANALYPKATIKADARLQEVNFGSWEQTPWDAISREALERWAHTPTNFQFPNGEQLVDFAQRVEQAFQHYIALPGDIVLVTHAGVIRKLISVHEQKPWQACLSVQVPFASVTCLKNTSNGQV